MWYNKIKIFKKFALSKTGQAKPEEPVEISELSESAKQEEILI